MKHSMDGNYELHQVIIDQPEVECHNWNYPVRSFFQEIEATVEQRFSNHISFKTRNLESK